MNFQNTLKFAKELDKKDSLKHFRGNFYIPLHVRERIVFILPEILLGLQPKQYAGLCYSMNWMTGPVLEWKVICMQEIPGSVS